MPPRSVSRERGRTRSRPSHSVESRSHSPSRMRSISPRSRSPTPRRRSISRSKSPLRSTKIVVEKLTKNINEDHLREIFSTYGEIQDMDMPMNRQFNTNRGTAYILYNLEADAEAAIAHMHESQLDGALINVSIVLPRRRFSPAPPLASKGANIDPRGPPSASFRGQARRGSPPRGYGRPPGGNSDTYRPRSVSRSRSPRRHRSRSRSYSSRSRTPPRRRGGGRRDSPGRSGVGRRRSPSYSSHSSYDRSRSRSRGRGNRGRR